MSDLSPAAQAIASAYDDTPEKDTGNHRYLWLAAALRAAADQICMKQPLGSTDADAGVFAAHHAISTSLLAIADELEGTN